MISSTRAIPLIHGSLRAAPWMGSARPLTLCLISEEYPPESGWGGIGTYSYNHARSLAALGHRVHVIARGWVSDRTFESEGVIIHRVTILEPTWRRGSWFLNVHFPESRQIWFWSRRCAEIIVRIAERERVDVIESPEYHAQGLNLAMSRLQIPVVVKLHTPAYLCRQINGVAVGGSMLDTMLSEYSERLLARTADLVTSPSRALADEVARHWRLNPAVIRVVPYAMDADLFKTCDDEPRQENLIQYVGRIEQRKGLVDLADAMPLILSACPDARLRMVGKDNPSAPGGESMVAFLTRRLLALGVSPERFEFVAHVERTRLPRIYRQAAVTVVPSRYENFPFTCMEAMASESAVIGAAVGGIPEIIDDGINGLLVQPADPPALADAIISLLRNSSHRQQLGAAARRSIQTRFSPTEIAAENLRTYRSVMA